MKLRLQWRFLVGALLLALMVPVWAGAVEFYPLAEVKSGMRGYGRTVVQGTQVDIFDVEILGILEYQGGQDKLILARVGGELMQKSGGIAQGMSGSPVYLDGKLLGALSYGYGFADHFIGMITPIQSMLKVLDLVPGTKLQLSSAIELDGHKYSQVALSSSGLAEEETLALRPISTPLLVSGLGDRGLSRLKKLFKDSQISVQSIGSTGGGISPTFLEAGSPIAVDLVTGDVRVSALGTLTYLDEEGRFVAFGHPFANRGNSNYYASYAQILTTVQSVDTPFKIGKPGPSFGMVSQDRNAGIAGQIGPSPTVIPVEVSVTDLNLNREKIFKFQVIEDPILSLNLIDAGVLEAMDSTLDRIGAGTAQVEFTIDSQVLPAGGFTRKNLFFSGFDIAAVSLGELFEALDMILNNEFTKVDITKISTKIMVEENRRTAKVEQARLLTPEVFPGDTAEIEVTLRPWRADPITRVVKVDIPGDISGGEVTVTVRNGTYLGYSESEEETEHTEEIEEPGKPENPAELKAKKNEPATKTNAESLELLVSDFVLREKNNEIVAEFYPPYSYPEAEEAFGDVGDDYGEGEEGLEATDFTEEPITGTETEKPITSALETEYVIQGSATFTMEIKDYMPLDSAESEQEWPGKTIKLDH